MLRTIRTMPSQAYLRECFDYNPETGELRWRIRPEAHFRRHKDMLGWNVKHAGKSAGALGSFGYTVLSIGNLKFSSHRVVWKIMTGDTPPYEVDHRNRDPGDIRWNNLRLATTQQNQANRVVQKNNVSGLKGVKFDPRRGTFHAAIIINKRRVWLGRFANKEDAHAAYCLAAQAHFGEFWNPG